MIGFGAHVEPRLGVMRALTEANQFLPVVSRRDDIGNAIYDFEDEEAQEWWRTATLESDRYLVADPDLPQIAIGEMNDLSCDDISEELVGCVGRLRRSGMQVLAIDQSRPDLDLKVAKVIVPGLRHFWRRLGPGRLYDVPVSSGWWDSPRSEYELNPKSVFF